LAGYEKPVGRRKQTALLADTRLAIGEGNRYTPVSYQASLLQASTVYDSTLTNQCLGTLYFRIDVQVGMRINQSKFTHQFYIAVQNLSNRANISAEIFDSRYQRTQFQYQLGLFPLIFYKLNW
jgi:ribosomal protein L31